MGLERAGNQSDAAREQDDDDERAEETSLLKVDLQVHQDAGEDEDDEGRGSLASARPNSTILRRP